MAVEDTLEVQVKTEADKATKSLDAMIDKIGGIANALNKIDVSRLSNVFDNLQKSMNGINSQISNMGNAAKNAGANMSKGMKEASKAADDVKKKTQEIGKAFSESDYVKAIKEYQKQFSELGKGIDFGDSLEDMEKLSNSLSEKLEDLKKREENFINLGISDPGGKFFENEQREIAETTNKLKELESQMKKVASETSSKVTPQEPSITMPKSSGWTQAEAQATLLAMQKATHEYDEQISKVTSLVGKTNAYKTAISRKSTGLEDDAQKTDSLGNKVDSLRKKLSELSKQGLNFGDADFDKTYQDLNKAEKELNEYRNGLIKVDDEQKKVYLSAPFSKLSAMASSAASRIKAFASSFASGISSIGKMGQSVDNLTSKLAKLFIGFQALKGVGKTLLGSIESASDYIEGYNYFDVAFTKIADESKNQFKQYGYDDAQSYADSFEQRLKTLNSKLTGFDIDKSGELSMSGGKSLGMDITQMTQYEAQIGQMTNSVGMMEEASLTSAKAMARLAGDMSSLTNMPIEQVMQNFTSGLSGMAMAVKKYGIDITQATLQEYAYKLGIDKKVATMTQAEKNYLREIAIVQQSKVAWGDQSDTINQLANQYRMLQAGLKNTAILIGRLLKPAVEAILPYLNAMVLAINDGLSYIGKLAGIKFNDTKIKTPELDVGGADSWDGMDSSVQDTTKNIEKADKAQKKFNKQLQGFDKLNNLTTTKNDGGKTPSTSTSGGGGGDVSGLLNDALLKSLADYEKYWNKHFKNMQNDAEDLKKKIKSLAKEAWETGDGTKIGSAIAKGLNSALNAIDKALPKIDSGMKKFTKILATAFNGLVNGLNWDKLGRVIGKSIKTVEQSLTLFFEKVDWDNFGRKLSKGMTAFLESGAIANFFKLLGAQFRAGVDTVFGFIDQFTKDRGFEKIGKQLMWGLKMWFSEMDKIDPKTGLNGWQEMGKSFYEGVKGILTAATMLLDGLDGKALGKAIEDALGQVDFKDLGKTLSDFAKTALEFGKDMVDGIPWEEIGESIGDFISGIEWGKVTWDFIKLAKSIVSGLAKAIKGFTKSAPLESAFIALFGIVKLTRLDKKVFRAIAEKVGITLGNALLKIDTSAIGTNITTVLGNAVTGIKSLGSKLITGIQTLSQTILTKIATTIGAEQATLSSIGTTIATGIGTAFSQVPALMTGPMSGLIGASAAATAATIFTSVVAAIGAAFVGFQLGKVIGSAIAKNGKNADYVYDFKFKDLFTYDIEEWKQGFSEWFNDIGSWIGDKTEKITLTVSAVKDAAFDTVVSAFEKVKDKTAEIVTSAKDTISGGIENLKKTWQSIKSSTAVKTMQEKGRSVIESAKKVWDGIKNSTVVKTLQEKGYSLMQRVWNLWDKFTSKTIKLDVVTDLVKKAIKQVVEWINKYIIGNLNELQFKVAGKKIGINIPEIKVPSNFATGGYPKSQELFYANENGRAELIGRQGNRATVVNNDQIIKSVSAGVSDAVFNTMNPVLTHLVASINKMNNSNTGTPLYVEGVNEGDIVRITTDANRDYKNRTGRPLYA